MIKLPLHALPIISLGMLKKIIAYCYLNFAQATQFVELYQPTYNPQKIRFLKPIRYKRASDDRLQLIAQNVPLHTIKTYLDIGSQLGYFVFKIAEYSEIKAVGIEQDRRAYYYAQSLHILNKQPRVSFRHAHLTPESAKTLGDFDMISLLSVFHHLVKYQGFDAADKIIDELVSRCKYFVFETGQANETQMAWSKNLSFMNASSASWLRNYLQSKRLNILSQVLVPTHLSSVQRHFYVCKKR